MVEKSIHDENVNVLLSMNRLDDIHHDSLLTSTTMTIVKTKPLPPPPTTTTTTSTKNLNVMTQDNNNNNNHNNIHKTTMLLSAQQNGTTTSTKTNSLVGSKQPYHQTTTTRMGVGGGGHTGGGLYKNGPPQPSLSKNNNNNNNHKSFKLLLSVPGPKAKQTIPLTETEKYLKQLIDGGGNKKKNTSKRKGSTKITSTTTKKNNVNSNNNNTNSCSNNNNNNNQNQTSNTNKNTISNKRKRNPNNNDDDDDNNNNDNDETNVRRLPSTTHCSTENPISNNKVIRNNNNNTTLRRVSLEDTAITAKTPPTTTSAMIQRKPLSYLSSSSLHSHHHRITDIFGTIQSQQQILPNNKLVQQQQTQQSLSLLPLSQLALKNQSKKSTLLSSSKKLQKTTSTSTSRKPSCGSAMEKKQRKSIHHNRNTNDNNNMSMEKSIKNNKINNDSSRGSSTSSSSSNNNNNVSPDERDGRCDCTDDGTKSHNNMVMNHQNENNNNNNKIATTIVKMSSSCTSTGNDVFLTGEGGDGGTSVHGDTRKYPEQETDPDNVTTHLITTRLPKNETHSEDNEDSNNNNQKRLKSTNSDNKGKMDFNIHDLNLKNTPHVVNTNRINNNSNDDNDDHSNGSSTKETLLLDNVRLPKKNTFKTTLLGTNTTKFKTNHNNCNSNNNNNNSRSSCSSRINNLVIQKDNLSVLASSSTITPPTLLIPTGEDKNNNNAPETGTKMNQSTADPMTHRSHDNDDIDGINHKFPPGSSYSTNGCNENEYDNDNNMNGIVLPSPTRKYRTTNQVTTTDKDGGLQSDLVTTTCDQNDTMMNVVQGTSMIKPMSQTLTEVWKSFPRISDTTTMMMVNGNNDDEGENNNSNNNTKGEMKTKMMKMKKKDQHKTGHFVRLNLKNKAGACLGARTKKTKTRSQIRWEEYKKEQHQQRNSNEQEHRMNISNNNNNNHNTTNNSIIGGDGPSMGNHIQQQKFRNTTRNSTPSSAVVIAGIDPVDDYIDGMFQNETNKKNMSTGALSTQQVSTTTGTKQKSATTTKNPPIPMCTGHQQLCRLRTVKKTGPNKGRKFYVCSLPRSDQCNHFQWVDDTHEAAQRALLSNKTTSGFVARQVSSYMGQMKTLTIPELKIQCKKKKLQATGKKTELLIRLAIWFRDEIYKSDVIHKDIHHTKDDVDNVDNVAEEDNAETEVNELPVEKALLSTTLSTTVITNENTDTSCEERDSEIDNKLDETNLEADDDESTCDDSSDDDSDEELEIYGHDHGDSVLLTGSSTITNSDINSNKIPEYQKGTKCELHSLLFDLFGYNEFRNGQEWAIRRCLAGQRSLLVAPTGFGKSLCYTLPAAIMDGVCIVVSPLLSLIQDQMRYIPARIPVATLSGSMSTAAMATTLDDIARGRIKIVYVSPERLASASFRRLFRRQWNHETKAYTDRIFPTVSLLCVDEAHCLSQWAHNFRPSYLRLQSLLQFIEPKSILAITATAGPRVVQSICTSLQIQQRRLPKRINTETDQNVVDNVDNDGDDNDSNVGVHISKTDRDNIDVCSLILNTQQQRLSKLLQILSKPKSKTEKLTGCLATGSVIVYVWRQRDAEVVAENIQGTGTIAGGVVIYHGGMDNHERNKAQSKFMRGKARICVATIAFGLGINKADVAGVIHMYLSSSPEHYVQEIGRAGRDGRQAKAISLILAEEAIIKHSLAHSDAICKSQVETIFQYLFQRMQQAQSKLPNNRCPSQPIYVAMPLNIANGCDCKEETIETLLSLLEQRSEWGPTLLNIEGIFYDKASIAPKRRSIQKLAEKEPIIQAILRCAFVTEQPVDTCAPVTTIDENELDYDQGFLASSSARHGAGQKFFSHIYGSYSFSVTEAANCLGDVGEPRHIFAALRRLEATGEIAFSLETTPGDRALNIRMTNEGMNVFSGTNQRLEMKEVVDETLERYGTTTQACATKVLDINFIMHRVSKVTINQVETNDDESKGMTCASTSAKSDSLKIFQKLVGQYFLSENDTTLNTVDSTLSTLHDEGDDGMVPFTKKFNTTELFHDVRSVISFIIDFQASQQQQQQQNSTTIDSKERTNNRMRLMYFRDQNGPNVVIPSEPPTSSQRDYQALMVTKFLHGITPISGMYSSLRQHYLFGKMQSVKYTVLHDAVFQMLG